DGRPIDNARIAAYCVGENGAGMGAAIDIHNILFTIDFSSAAETAFPHAVAVAGRYWAKLYVAHVITPDMYGYAPPESAPALFQQLREHARQRMVKGHARNGHVQRENVAGGLFQVVENPASHAHPADDGGEIVVQKDQISRLAGHINSAPSYGHTDVGSLQGRRIVHPVPGHGYHGAPNFEHLHQAQFLLRADAREDANLVRAPGQFVGSQFGDFRAAEILARLQACLAPNALRRDSVISGNHHHANTRLPTLLYCVAHPGAKRIGKPYQAEKAQTQLG